MSDGGRGGGGGPGAIGSGGAQAHPWRRLRWVSVTANGMVLSHPGIVYAAHLVAHTWAQRAHLYDATNTPTNLVTPLAAPSEQQSRPFPPLPNLGVPLANGLYVSFSTTPFTGALWVGWERQ